jgi:hypothetical protein
MANSSIGDAVVSRPTRNRDARRLIFGASIINAAATH